MIVENSPVWRGRAASKEAAARQFAESEGRSVDVVTWRGDRFSHEGGRWIYEVQEEGDEFSIRLVGEMSLEEQALRAQARRN